MTTSTINNQTQIKQIEINRQQAADQTKSINTAEGDHAAQVKKREQASGENYNVELSATARKRAAERNMALNIARDTDPVRADLVAELKAKIAAGTYNVDPEKIADGILKEAIRDDLAAKF